MITLDLMELADLSRPSQIAKEIIRQIPEIQAPINIEDIAYACGITEINKESLVGIEGALVANTEKTKGIILIKKDSRPQRQRFTLGHELGHFLIPRHGHEMKCGLSSLTTQESKSLNTSEKIELEANIFSSEILMPELLVKQYSGFREAPSIDIIRSMANKFDMSFKAFARRYVDLHDDPIAIVFAHYSYVDYSVKNADFPFWITPKKGSPLPPKSYSRISMQSASPNTIVCGISDSSIWVEERKGFIKPELILEELYVMNDGYTATLITFDEDIEEIE